MPLVPTSGSASADAAGGECRRGRGPATAVGGSAVRATAIGPLHLGQRAQALARSATVSASCAK